MAGSIKWFLYTDDSGADFAIKLDESNTEAVNGGTQDFLPTSTVRAGVPRNIKVRELFYANIDRTRVIRCVALTTQIYGTILGGQGTQEITDPLNPLGAPLALIRANGERRVIPFGQDTGQDDGDPS